MNTKPEQRIALSMSNLLLIIASVLSLVVLWQLRSLILILMIAVVLAATIAPVVDWAERWHVPRWVAVISVYLGFLITFVGFSVLFGPTVFEQIERLVRKSPVFLTETWDLVEGWFLHQSAARPELVSQLFDLLDVQGIIRWAVGSTQQVLTRSINVTAGIVGGTFSLILAIFLSGYMLSDSRTLIQGGVRLLPKPWDERLERQVKPVSLRIGSYIRGRVLVSAILGVIITTSLTFLGLSDYAIGLGAIAGVTNLIPFLGPLLGAIPALVVAISQGWWTLLWVLILFVIVQNLETYVLDPLLVGSSVGVHPLYQLLAVLAGTQAIGIIGALIVPPWVAGAAYMLDNLYLEPKRKAEEQEALTAQSMEIEPVVSSP